MQQAGNAINVIGRVETRPMERLYQISGTTGRKMCIRDSFNIGGRVVWASLSDKLGRKTVYFIYSIVGAVLYASIPVSYTHLRSGNHLISVETGVM